MRIGMNAMYLDPGRSGGPETYLRQLVPALLSSFPELELEVATTRRGTASLRGDTPTGGGRLVVHELPSDEGERLRRLHAEQVLVPRLARERGWNAIHSLANTGPMKRGAVPHVLTLHDVIFFRHRTMPLVSTLAHKAVVRPAAKAAKVIVTAAEAARDEICDELGLDPARFVIAPHGPGRQPGPAAPEDELRERYGLGGARVVLNVAAKRPHKNQEVLIRALAHLPEDVVLVLVGHPEDYDRRLRSLPGAERTRFADYVPDADLEGLFALAWCAAFPTLSEGFGLPVLEAIRRGVPTACSEIPVLRELGAEVPRYFDPHDPRAVATAIEAAAGAAERARTAGPERARLFTWERSARATMEAYERACA